MLTTGDWTRNPIFPMVTSFPIFRTRFALFTKPRLTGFCVMVWCVFMVVLCTPSQAYARKVHHHHAAHAGHASAVPTSRYAAIILDDDTGRVLLSNNPDRRSYPASLTKMMTLYLLFDALDQGRLTLHSQLSVSAHATNQAPSRLALSVGEQISVEDAILALVTKSANDVAVVVAEAVGGSETQFAQEMTAKAHALGMNSTTYRNASGLPNLGQVTTPRDQTILAHALIHNHARYYHFFSTREFTWAGQVIPSHNRFVLNYEGADGLKTGFINASGFNLVASAVRNGHRLIGAVFGGNTGAWRDHRMAELFDKGYAHINGGETEMVSAQEEEPAPQVVTPKPQPQKASKPAKQTKPLKVAHAKARHEVESDVSAIAWAIQVGAFSNYKPAHHAAAQAAHSLGKLRAKASIDIDSERTKKHSVYRARLIGFSAIQAQAACKKLAREKHECHVIQPES